MTVEGPFVTLLLPQGPWLAALSPFCPVICDAGGAPVVLAGEGRTATTRVFVFCSGDTDCGWASLRHVRVHCGPPGTLLWNWVVREHLEGPAHGVLLGRRRSSVTPHQS